MASTKHMNQRGKACSRQLRGVRGRNDGVFSTGAEIPSEAHDLGSAARVRSNTFVTDGSHPFFDVATGKPRDALHQQKADGAGSAGSTEQPHRD